MVENGRRVRVEFYPYKKGGKADKVLAILRGRGHKRLRGSFNIGA